MGPHAVAAGALLHRMENADADTDTLDFIVDVRHDCLSDQPDEITAASRLRAETCINLTQNTRGRSEMIVTHQRPEVGER